jgi:hypothetical protein
MPFKEPEEPEFGVNLLHRGAKIRCLTTPQCEIGSCLAESPGIVGGWVPAGNQFQQQGAEVANILTGRKVIRNCRWLTQNQSLQFEKQSIGRKRAVATPLAMEILERRRDLDGTG